MLHCCSSHLTAGEAKCSRSVHLRLRRIRASTSLLWVSLLWGPVLHNVPPTAIVFVPHFSSLRFGKITGEHEREARSRRCGTYVTNTEPKKSTMQLTSVLQHMQWHCVVSLLTPLMLQQRHPSSRATSRCQRTSRFCKRFT